MTMREYNKETFMRMMQEWKQSGQGNKEYSREALEKIFDVLSDELWTMWNEFSTEEAITQRWTEYSPDLLLHYYEDVLGLPEFSVSLSEVKGCADELKEMMFFDGLWELSSGRFLTLHEKRGA